MVDRHPGESARAFAARLAYVTMGPSRSIDKVGQQAEGKRAAGHIQRWSQQWKWAESAAAWDAAQAREAERRAGDEYQQRLAAHRTAAMNRGDELIAVGRTMLAQLQAQQADLRYTPAHLAAVAKALVTGLDLQAHALGIDRILMESEP